MRTIKALRREALFIRRSDISDQIYEAMRSRFTFEFISDQDCSCGAARSGRDHDDDCAGRSEYILCTTVRINNVPFVKLPLGSLASIRGYLKKRGIKLDIIDRNARTRTYPMRFIGSLRDPHQPLGVNALVSNRRGILKSPPRTGKTVMATAAACEIQQRTLFIGAQREWLINFQKTFIGDKDQPPMTNLPPSKIGFIKSLKDAKKYVVGLATIHTFQGPKGKKLLQELLKVYGLIIFDEIQGGAADQYLQIIYSLNPTYMWGLSGTPSRKDGKHVMTFAVLGKIVQELKVKGLRPTIKLIETDYVEKRDRARWDQFVGSMEKDPGRLKLIAKWAVKDAKAGNIILIPMLNKTAIKALVAAINRIAGKTIAIAFDGGTSPVKREPILKEIQEGKWPVVVGTVKILSVGTNIPIANYLYEVSLSNNNENCFQRVSRILTPDDRKDQAVVRIFLDKSKIRKNCLRGEWFGSMTVDFKPIISDADRNRLMEYFNGPSQRYFI